MDPAIGHFQCQMLRLEKVGFQVLKLKSTVCIFVPIHQSKNSEPSPKMLITESYADVSTKAGGDMREFLQKSRQDAYQPFLMSFRNIRLPSENRWLSQGEVSRSCGLL
jgi:hypothetical protein